MPYNGCIFLISARKKILIKCLNLLYENYNKKYKYPILIFYQGNIYDDEKYKKGLIHYFSKKNQKVTFYKIKSDIPKHLSEKDLFYMKKDNAYVKKCFSKNRIGYLHAITWKINSFNNKILKKYDWYLMIDDDSWFKEPLDFDFFEECDKKGYLCGTAYMWNYVHYRVLDTRVNLYKWIQDYVKKYNINVKNKKLDEALKEGENDIIDDRKCNKKFHSLDYLAGNCNIYNKKMFETPEWKIYNEEFNKLAGGYRYRWGDCEIISLYCHIHLDNGMYNFKLKEKNVYHNKLPGSSMIRKKI